jgi:hypothetical protein
VTVDELARYISREVALEAALTGLSARPRIYGLNPLAEDGGVAPLWLEPPARARRGTAP